MNKLFILLFGSLLCFCTSSDKYKFTPQDQKEIQALEQEYTRVWLESDTLGLMNLLTDDIVLQPAGMEPIVGKEAAMNHWFPDDGSKTTINSYTITNEEIDGTSEIAYSRGRGDLNFTYEYNDQSGDYQSKSISLTIYKKNENGEWKISKRMWARLNN